MNQNVLEFLITAKDEASAKLNNVANVAKTLGSTFTVVGGAITAALGLSLKAAADAQAQMAQFNTTINNSTGGTQAVKDALLKAADASQKLGFDNDNTEQSLAKFFQRTGDVTTAIKLNNVAMDLARAKNLDLGTATTLVNQVLSGNGRVLKQYGINLKEAGTPLEALNQLHTLTQGSAEAFASTLEGQNEVLQRSFGDLEKSIGAALIPALTGLIQKITPVINTVVDWTKKNPELTQKIVIWAAAIGGVMVVLGPLLLALPTLITLFTLLSGPVGIVIIILGVLAYTINNVVQIVDLLKNHWSEVWQGIKIMTKEAIDAIIGYFQPLLNTLGAVGNAIGGVLGQIGGAAKGVASAVGGTFNNAVSAITGKRAGGGPVSAGGTYLVGEQGPELFTPASSGFITANGGGAINITISGAVMTTEAANQMAKVIMQQLKRVSRIGI